MPPRLDERIAARIDTLSPAEARTAAFFLANRERVMVASAALLAAEAATSDATVVRTARALGYLGLGDLRQSLAAEMRRETTLPGRIETTLKTLEDGPAAAFIQTLDLHVESIERLRRDISARAFAAAVDAIAKAGRIFVFGLGPSAAMATYAATQLSRFGVDAAAITQAGSLLADQLCRFRKQDLAIVLAYGKPYREVTVLLEHAAAEGVPAILITDTLAPAMKNKVRLAFSVVRGQAERFSTHTATLALLEAIMVGVASKRPLQAVAALDRLNTLRAKLAG